MTATIELLQRDHVNFARLLNVFERQVDLAPAAGGPSIELVRLILLYFREYPRKVHHPKENLIYSALLLHRPKEAELIFDVIANHRDLSERMEVVERAVDALAKDKPASVDIFCHLARKFIAGERAHMTEEETHLYPAALRLLTAQEWNGVDHYMGNAADPLFGDTVTGPFEKLRDTIFEINRALCAVQEKVGTSSVRIGRAAS